ncbi:hypothetical protein [Paenibacillus xylaniclasticus]|uniref:hypothetical protein n=1 Tax=Paenibacillus xylaniclasticus TaxID=588083 RepID=UPI000FD909C8|nr:MULTISPECIES: hypothetical protein [Paenibacillus]GFN31512.1 hypothetical protein PCURB6_17720 [Paenibacillus curdlanolyticus]
MVKITQYDGMASQLSQLGVGTPVYVWFNNSSDYYYLYYQGLIDNSSIALFQGDTLFRIPVNSITAIAV